MAAPVRRFFTASIAAVVLTTSCSGADQGSARSATTNTVAADGRGPTTTATSSTAATTTSTGSAAPSTSATRVPPALAGRKIVIDPGHNGLNGANSRQIRTQVDAGGFLKDCNTTGTSGAGLTESQFNWEAAGVIASTLEAAGAEVELTRTSDDGVGPCVDQRGATAERVGADVLISIHADGSGPKNHGFHVIHPASLDGYTDTTVERSLELAEAVRDALVDQGWSTSNYLGERGLDQRGDLGTLNRSPAPSVMIECGNMRNADDLTLLKSEASKAELAMALVAALTEFFRTADLVE